MSGEVKITHTATMTVNGPLTLAVLRQLVAQTSEWHDADRIAIRTYAGDQREPSTTTFTLTKR